MIFPLQSFPAQLSVQRPVDVVPLQKKKKGVMAQNKHEIGKTVGLQKFSHFLSLSSAIAHSLHFLVFLKSLLTVSFT